MARRAAAAALVAGWAATACSPPPAGGTLALAWRLAGGGAEQVVAVSVQPAWAGAGRGPVRDAGWTTVPCVAGPVTVTPGAVLAEPVAAGRLPAGTYDRVFIAAEAASAVDARGRTVPLAGHVEPIARGFDLAPGGAIAVEIELVVRPPSSAGDGRPELFVRDARVVPPATASGSPAHLERADG